MLNTVLSLKENARILSILEELPAFMIRDVLMTITALTRSKSQEQRNKGLKLVKVINSACKENRVIEIKKCIRRNNLEYNKEKE